MNTAFILREIFENPEITQRELAARLDISLGSVNSLINRAAEEGLLIKEGSSLTITPAGMEYLAPYKVDRAVVLAAGFGSRFVPLTWETPKGLLEVFGERMVERQICQLREAGITEIYIMVGYLKEKFEYLIDKYGVKLVFNPEYDRKNTISTLYHAREIFRGHNTYLLNSDNWLRNNMYHAYEPYAWYSAAYDEGPTNEWCLTFDKKKRITDGHIGGNDSWVMYGPAYFSREFSEKFFPALIGYYNRPGTENDYWEQIYLDWLHGLNGLKKKDAPAFYINPQPADQVYEFENLEELRAFDEKYIHSSDNAAMSVISRVFQEPESEIRAIKCLKAGMTNRSFGFRLKGKQYICRVPGEGTEKLISRREEAENVAAAASLGITENIVFFDPETGYKISEFYPDARVADPKNEADMTRCMALLRKLHESGVTVGHDFDIEERLSFYERLCASTGGIPFEDYQEVRAHADELIAKLKGLGRKKVLAHIDSVADNFIFIHEDRELKLIDWEYSGMADPLIDLGMCAIYSYMKKDEVNNLVRLYFGNSNFNQKDLAVVYAYMALGGLLWTLWAVYKSHLGVTFGEYTLIMYRYAKDYYKESIKLIDE